MQHVFSQGEVARETGEAFSPIIQGPLEEMCTEWLYLK